VSWTCLRVPNLYEQPDAANQALAVGAEGHAKSLTTPGASHVGEGISGQSLRPKPLHLVPTAADQRVPIGAKDHATYPSPCAL